MLDVSDAPMVRSIMGMYLPSSVTDAELMNDAVIASTWAEILAFCPSAASEIDPDKIATINHAQAYLVAGSRLATTPVLTSSRLGDQQMTIDAESYGATGDVWSKNAYRLLSGVCAIPAPRFGSFFALAHGRRGE